MPWTIPRRPHFIMLRSALRHFNDWKLVERASLKSVTVAVDAFGAQQADILRSLLRAGAMIDARDHNGCTANS